MSLLFSYLLLPAVVVRAQLASCASASVMASCWHDTKAWPAIVDPTKHKYLTLTVMTAASTVLAKSVRFLEHVSPWCCAGIAGIVPVSRSA